MTWVGAVGTPTITVYLASIGTNLNPASGEGTTSQVGHAFYSIDPGDGSGPQFFGWAPDQSHLGFPSDVAAPGYVYHNDNVTYLSQSQPGQVWSSGPVPITQAQYDTLLNFGSNPRSYGFSPTYIVGLNDCDSFVGKALQVSGIQQPPAPTVNINGIDVDTGPSWMLLPQLNKYVIRSDLNAQIQNYNSNPDAIQVQIPSNSGAMNVTGSGNGTTLTFSGTGGDGATLTKTCPDSPLQVGKTMVRGASEFFGGEPPAPESGEACLPSNSPSPLPVSLPLGLVPSLSSQPDSSGSASSGVKPGPRQIPQSPPVPVLPSLNIDLPGLPPPIPPDSSSLGDGAVPLTGAPSQAAPAGSPKSRESNPAALVSPQAPSPPISPKGPPPPLTPTTVPSSAKAPGAAAPQMGAALASALETAGVEQAAPAAAPSSPAPAVRPSPTRAGKAPSSAEPGQMPGQNHPAAAPKTPKTIVNGSATVEVDLKSIIRAVTSHMERELTRPPTGPMSLGTGSIRPTPVHAIGGFR